MSMECGNTAALRSYEADQDRLEKQAPTDRELENYIEDWMTTKQNKMGVEFVMEPLNEAGEAERICLFCTFRDEGAAEIGHTVRAIVNLYWRPSAEKAAAEHNFAEDREP